MPQKTFLEYLELLERLKKEKNMINSDQLRIKEL